MICGLTVLGLFQKFFFLSAKNIILNEKLFYDVSSKWIEFV